MAIPGVTEVATQDLFGGFFIPKYTGDIWFVDAGIGTSDSAKAKQIVDAANPKKVEKPEGDEPATTAAATKKKPVKKEKEKPKEKKEKPKAKKKEDKEDLGKDEEARVTRTRNRKAIKAQATKDLGVPDNLMNIFFDFADEDVKNPSDEMIEQVAGLGLAKKGKDGKYQLSDEGKDFLAAADKKNSTAAMAVLKKALDRVKAVKANRDELAKSLGSYVDTGADTKESDMHLSELALQALGVGISLARGTERITKEEGLRLLESFQDDIEAALLEMALPGNGADVMTIEVQGERVPIQELIESYQGFTEAATVKSKAQGLMRSLVSILKDKRLPAAVRREIEDVRRVLRRTWKDLGTEADGDVTMEAEMLEEKHKTIESITVKDPEKLAEIYGSEMVTERPDVGLDAVVSYAPTSFADLDAADAAKDAAAEASKRTYQLHRLIDNVMADPAVEDKAAALTELMVEFVGRVTMDVEQAAEDSVYVSTHGDTKWSIIPVPDNGVEQAIGEVTKADDTADLSEVASFTECISSEMAELEPGSMVTGRVVDFVESSGVGKPAYIDLIPVIPGWGNKKDNHYYDKPVVIKFAPVWNGAKMWATDHKQQDKNALNQVTEVIQSPAGYTDDGIPFARAVILSPEFEEIARRRKAAGILHTLHNSIVATGQVRKKSFEKDGRKGKYVEFISNENAGIDWVTKAGAGGHARDLAESNTGGDVMKKVEDVAQETPVEQVVTEVEEVALAEGDETPAEQTEEQASEPEQVKLGEVEVAQLVEGARLPQAVKDLLVLAEYADEDELKAKITGMTEAFTKATGSGKPAVTSGNVPPVARQKRTLAEIEATMDEVNEQWIGEARRPRQEVKQ